MWMKSCTKAYAYSLESQNLWSYGRLKGVESTQFPRKAVPIGRGRLPPLHLIPTLWTLLLNRSYSSYPLKYPECCDYRHSPTHLLVSAGDHHVLNKAIFPGRV